jgi:NADH:ubiquinone oxidoreductase subunit 3 (subunit A)
MGLVIAAVILIAIVLFMLFIYFGSSTVNHSNPTVSQNSLQNYAVSCKAACIISSAMNNVTAWCDFQSFRYNVTGQVYNCANVPNGTTSCQFSNKTYYWNSTFGSPYCANHTS